MQNENQKVSINLSRMLSDSFKAKTSSNQNHAYENEVFDIKYKFLSGSYNYSLDYYRNHGSTEYDSFGSNLSQIHKDNHLKAMMIKELGDTQISFSYVRKGNEINQSAASATDYTHTKIDSLIFENIIGKDMIIGKDAIAWWCFGFEKRLLVRWLCRSIGSGYPLQKWEDLIMIGASTVVSLTTPIMR